MFRFAALILIAAAGSAFATNKPGSPLPEPHSAAASRSSSAATASTSSAANATAAQESSAAGGAGGTVDSRWAAIALPQPSFTPPMAAMPCPAAQVQQSAWSAGWTFVSRADASTDTRDCTAIIVINSLIERCQYGRAQLALDMLAARALPGFAAKVMDYPDLSPIECALLKLPPRPAVMQLIPPAAAKPAAPAAGQPRQGKPAAKAAAAECGQPARRTGAVLIGCL